MFFSEFALVIMSALCQASESICVIAALETNIVKNVISFMEAVDSKMHEVWTKNENNFFESFFLGCKY